MEATKIRQHVTKLTTFFANGSECSIISNTIEAQWVWGGGEKGYLPSGSWGALVIISGELGSKHINIFQQVRLLH